MFNRAEVIDQNFLKHVNEGHFPQALSPYSELTKNQFIDLFETQMQSRHLDLYARILKNENKCYYTIGSSGHEGNAAVGQAFKISDMAFLHYRSGAFMLQRAKQLPGSTPLFDTWLSFLASREDPISGGRHKVFGSFELNVPPQTSTIASHLPKAVGAAFSISRARYLQIKTSTLPDDSVVLCSFGDASSNHSTAQGAFNTASLIADQKIGLPIVFICEDNGIGISVPTNSDWIEKNFSHRPHFNYLKCDGLNLSDVYQKSVLARSLALKKQQPVFLHIKTVRLMGHAGSDMETNYLSLKQMEDNEFQDPLLHSARICLEQKFLSQHEIINLYQSVRARVIAVANEALTREPLNDPMDVASTITACAHSRKSPEFKSFEVPHAPFHMAKLLNFGLAEILDRYPQSLIFGEDVAQKGGVYNVTDGLYKKFGARRVFNSPLDEQSILGTAIGLAHNGFLPIPEIQFLAYVHNAEDQIRGEAATLAFFSKGQFVNPMILRIAGLPYQKGFGGHFHNDNSLSVFRDIPGIIVAVPSRGDDAVQMLRTCAQLAWEKGRVIVFIEPIALYMTRDLHRSGDKAWAFSFPLSGEIGLGEFRVYGDSDDILILTYGNGTYLSLQAQKILKEDHRITAAVLDLRWLHPLPKQDLIQEIEKYKSVLIVDECRQTGSLSEGLVALIIEKIKNPPRLQILAALDCFIPLGQAATSGLPQTSDIVLAAKEMVLI